MNRMMEFLNSTIEVHNVFADMKLPTLDVKIWMKDGLIEYEFFEKPMRANTLLHAKTAKIQISPHSLRKL